MPRPDSKWLLPAFIVFWLAISGALSLLGGWYELSQRFKRNDAVDGERFYFRSGAIGWRWLPVSYGSCLFATIGSKSIALSVLFPFRFLHPPLLIPWSAVERCEKVKLWFMNQVAVPSTHNATGAEFPRGNAALNQSTLSPRYGVMLCNAQHCGQPDAAPGGAPVTPGLDRSTRKVRRGEQEGHQPKAAREPGIGRRDRHLRRLGGYAQAAGARLQDPPACANRGRDAPVRPGASLSEIAEIGRA